MGSTAVLGFTNRLGGGRCLAPWVSLVSVGQADSAMVSTDMRLVAWENGARSGQKRRRIRSSWDVDCLSTSSTYHALLKGSTRAAVVVKYNTRVGVCPIISVSQSSFRLVRYGCGIASHDLGNRYVQNTSPERGRWFVHGSSFGLTASANRRSLRIEKVTEKFAFQATRKKRRTPTPSGRQAQRV